jgi:hypothetical protein
MVTAAKICPPPVVFELKEEGKVCQLPNNRLFDRFRDYNLKLKPSKCSLFQSKLKYLGHVVSAEGIEVDQDKIKSIKEMKPPSNTSEVRSFVGIVNYYRSFIHNLAEKCAPLFQLIKKDARFVWDSEAQSAFENLKSELAAAPIEFTKRN